MYLPTHAPTHAPAHAPAHASAHAIMFQDLQISLYYSRPNPQKYEAIEKNAVAVMCLFSILPHTCSTTMSQKVKVTFLLSALDTGFEQGFGHFSKLFAQHKSGVLYY